MGFFGNLFRDKSRDDEFVKLCSIGSLAQVKEALSSWGYVKAKDKNSATPVMTATMNGDLEVIKLILKKLGRDSNFVNLSDSKKWTALHYAALESSFPEIITLLVEAGANTELRNSENLTPLMMSLSNKNVEIMKSLIKAGADPSVENTKGMPLIMQCITGIYTGESTIEHLKELIRLGANVDRRMNNGKGHSALVQAVVMSCPPEVIELLADNTKNINAKGSDGHSAYSIALSLENSPNEKTNTENIKSALSILESKGAVIDFIDLCKVASGDRVRKAILNGADVNKPNSNGITPLMMSIIANPTAGAFTVLLSPFATDEIMNADPLTRSVMMSATVNLNARDNNGYTALDHAMKKCNFPATEILKSLGARANILRDKSRDEEFCRLCESGSVEDVTSALKSWGYVTAKDKSGKTPLMCAAEKNPDEKVIQLLIDYGADINAVTEEKKSSALHWAGSNTNPKVAEILVKAGANLEAVNIYGNTPLMCAALLKKDNTATINALIKAGANVNASPDCSFSENGHSLTGNFTVLMRAVNSGMIENVKAILDALSYGDINESTIVIMDGNSLEATALLQAIAGKSEDIVKLLIERGARVNVTEWHKEFTPLDLAYKFGNQAIIQILRNAGARRNFYELCRTGTLAEVQEGIDVGEDINGRDSKGGSPLVYAAHDNHDPRVVEALIREGADIRQRVWLGNHNYTLTDIAMMGNNIGAAQVLRRYGIPSTM